jgi:hypothetical protein
MSTVDPNAIPRAEQNAGPQPAPHALPESIPERWLAQIRDAVKADQPSVVWTLLGSSVLGAVIAAGSSFGTSYINSRASVELEIKKSQLEEARIANKAKFDSYKMLDQNLNDLLSAFSGLTTLMEIARKNNQLGQKDVTASFRSQINGLGVKEGILIDMKSDPNIEPDLWTEIDKPITSITTAMRAADSDLASFLQNTDSIKNQLTDAIKAVRAAREALRNQAVP